MVCALVWQSFALSSSSDASVLCFCSFVSSCFFNARLAVLSSIPAYDSENMALRDGMKSGSKGSSHIFT